MVSSRRIELTRVRGTRALAGADRVAAEEPLEVRVEGQPFAVIMRTPGADEELTAGFLYSERIVREAGQLAAIEHCRSGSSAARANVVKVRLVDGAAGLRLDQRRRVVMNSSCGMCGRVTIESLKVQAPRIAAEWDVESSVVSRLPDILRASQTAFQETGGLHAAGLFTRDGVLLTSAEDVGRHNAVDKVIGRKLLEGELPLDANILFVSGRTSFEIVQKAFLAGIPIVGAVSAPSSLAIDLAAEAGITLIGFVRGNAFNIYSHPHRVRSSPKSEARRLDLNSPASTVPR